MNHTTGDIKKTPIQWHSGKCFMKSTVILLSNIHVKFSNFHLFLIHSATPNILSDSPTDKNLPSFDKL